MDLDTFLTAFHVIAGGLLKEVGVVSERRRRGRPPLLSDSEAVVGVGVGGPDGPAWPAEGAGRKTGKTHLADGCFAGKARQRRWAESRGARVLTPRDASAPENLNGRRQIAETAFAMLCDCFHLRFSRARTIDGLEARIAGKGGG